MGEVDFTASHHHLRRCCIQDLIRNHDIRRGFGNTLPVVVELAHLDVVADTEIGGDVGARAGVACQQVSLAVVAEIAVHAVLKVCHDKILVDDRQAVQGDKERPERFAQFEHNCVIVDDAGFGNTIREEIRVSLSDSDHAVHAELDVACHQFAAVMERDSLVQIEGPSQAVVRDVPT